LLLTAFCFSIFVTTADILIQILYDERYHAASWMLPILILGSWFSMLASINESTLLGLGKPSYSAMSNSAKLGFLLIGLPVAFTTNGLLGCVVVIALADLARYVPLCVGQVRERFSFVTQDLVMTCVVIVLIGMWEWLREAFGLGGLLHNLMVDLGAYGVG
jgi:O-antigen/teichoic acid export membrane protein